MFAFVFTDLTLKLRFEYTFLESEVHIREKRWKARRKKIYKRSDNRIVYYLFENVYEWCIYTNQTQFENSGHFGNK